jgi:protein-tyrosine phosphatase
MINQITEKVSICEAQEVTAFNLANGATHFDCVLNVSNDVYPGEEELCRNLGIEYIHQPVPRKKTKTTDALKKDLCIAADLLEKLTKSYRVLIHCESGVDRAPFVVAKYLCNIAYLTMPQAYRIVKQQRKHILEHYEWI